MRKSVNISVQDQNGKYFLQMRDGKEGICHPLMWNFFGGGIKGEEDPFAAAAREIHEELRLTANPEDFELLGEVRDEQAGHVHFVRLKRQVDWKDITLNEGAGVGKFSKEEIFRIHSTPATKSLAERFI
jgi:8-oxo-dGTP pyrophosphatase MutT (NUDIX family)